MKYSFFKRDRFGMSKLIAEVEKGDKIVWRGKDARAIRSWLVNNKFGRLGGEFDVNNDKHWELLPIILSGSRFWVVVDR